MNPRLNRAAPPPAPDLTGGHCRGSDLRLFFADEQERTVAATARMRPVAVTYCQPCPIRAACAARGEAMEYGLWGGVLQRGRKIPAVDLLAVTA